MKEYDTATAEVIRLLEKAGYSSCSVRRHELCYDGLREHLDATQQTFSLDAGIEWLSARKNGWKAQTYNQYRLALYRLDRYMRDGGIHREAHCKHGIFAYRDAGYSYAQLPENFKATASEYHGWVCECHSPETARKHFVGVTDFLLFLAKCGCGMPSELTIAHLAAYSQHLRDKSEHDRKQACGAKELIALLHDDGHIPKCFLSVGFAMDEENLNDLLLPEKDRGDSVQPSKNLDVKASKFLNVLTELGYSKNARVSFESTLNSLFKFLEINRIEYSPEAVSLRLGKVSGTPRRERFRQQLRQFDDFLRTGEAKSLRNYTWKPTGLDALPKWCQNITNSFLNLREREGWAKRTIEMSRAASVRFFGFVTGKGVSVPSSITPELIKEFHNTDPHSTQLSRNMYGGGVRKLLQYMAGLGLVPQNLSFALSNQYAPKYKIVSIMTPEMETAVFCFRENAKTPLELRDAAIVMIGMRMGLRASDIARLKITDMDLHNSKLSILQCKTSKAVTLPIPVDVGNSVYRYIAEGRPQVGGLGDGYIFLSHKAPYRPVTFAICKPSLDRVLAKAGLELRPMQGFHITRRTFATNLLAARNKVDIITDSLGHATRQSVDSYLAHDEASMRLCSLPFTIGGGE
jgi:site-specific recombinase XerD